MALFVTLEKGTEEGGQEVMWHDIVHTVLDAVFAVAVWYLKRALARRDARQEQRRAELKHEVYVEIDRRTRPLEKRLGLNPSDGGEDTGVPD